MDTPKVKSNLVVSSNDLVHAKYDLTLWQKRVFVYAISQLEKDDAGFQPIKMNVSDIIKFFNGSDGAKTYTAILEAPKNLDKTIEIPYFTDKGFLRYGFVKLLQRYTIPGDDQEENQYIEICFNNDLKPHLLELKEKFLKYDIRNVIELQSTYSFRMFEILKSYEFRKTIELDIDYLRKILEVTDKYKSYKDFRIYIIDKAKQDLTKYCDITFTYEEKKATKGKKIESLIFHILKNDSLQREVKKDLTKVKKEKITENIVIAHQNIDLKKKEKSTEQIKQTVSEKLVLELSPIVVSQFGVSLKVFMDLAEQYTEGEVRQAVAITQKTIKTGKVENVAGFFVGAVRGKYADNKQQKKQAEVEKKAKIIEATRVGEALEKKKKEEKQAQFEQEMIVFDQLIQQDPSLVQTLTETIQLGIMSSYYKKDKSFEDNRAHPLLKAAFLNLAKELRPDSFILEVR
ncbi:MAG: replication initiation protein [Saprospiraceae bacterium]|nr:replication initiation protein [Saprospiraceae bacterium]